MSRLKKALDKAKESRGEYTQSPLPSAVPAAPPEQADAERSPQDRFMPFKPVYTTTKVIKCETSFLRKNRILPVCTENGADQVKILRTHVLQSLSDEGKNTLLVTSANPGEGKTITAINLAISFSHQTNRTVLLVDGDIRKPTIDKYLGLSEGPGLSDYLIGKAEMADILINPGMERIVILPGADPSPIRRNCSVLREWFPCSRKSSRNIGIDLSSLMRLPFSPRRIHWFCPASSMEFLSLWKQKRPKEKTSKKFSK